jgi:PAS domain S-box-containing protein
MEIALRESKRKYKDLQDESIDGHAWTDMEGHLIEVNDAYKKMMGYSEDELRNLTYKDITPEKWHASERLILTEQILARGYSDPYEKELIRKDGTIFPVELRAYLIKDAQGNNTGMRAVVRDITDRTQAENKIIMTASELRESNITLKVLLKQRENDKSELEEKILSNIKHIIMPYIEKLKKNKSMSEELAYLNILESNLKEIVSPFSSKLSFKYLDFTPKEIMVANLIKDGRQDKDITELLNISIDTVKFHRKNIRKKLGIYGKRKNLRSHLLSIAE